MEGLFGKVLDRLTDPLQIILLVVIAGLFYLLLKKEKALEGMQACINGSIKEHTVVSTRLVTLVEGMVYGRNLNARQ